MRIRPDVLLACVLGSAALSRAETLTSPMPPSATAALERAQSLIRARRAPEGFALLDSLIGAARGSGSDPIRLRALATKGGNLAFLGQADRAEASLFQALPLALQLGDSTIYAESARWLAFSWLGAGRLKAADSLYAAAMPVAVACGAWRAECYMRLGRAYVLMSTGRAREAIPNYRATADRFHGIHDSYGEQEAIVGLGRCFHTLGRLDSSAACYRLCASRAHASGQLASEGDALNNLGAIEYERGDPAQALQAFQNALGLYREAGVLAAGSSAAQNVAMMLAQMGRIGEAEAELDSLAREAKRRGLREAERRVLLARGQMFENEDAAAAAAFAYRTLLAIEEPQASDLELEARCGLARSLVRMDSVTAALTILDAVSEPTLRAASANARNTLRYTRASSLMRLGRSAEVGELATQLARENEALQEPGRAMNNWGLAAVAASRGRDLVSARRYLARALAAWMRERSRSKELQWRDPKDQLELSMVDFVGKVVLTDGRWSAAARRERAWDLFQTVKSRSLLDRLTRSAPPESAGIRALTLARLQRDVLRPDEVLIDLYIGADTSFVFAITRDRVEVAGLPDWRAIRQRTSNLASLLHAESSASAAGPDFVRAAAIEAGQWLLGAQAGLIRSVRRIVVSPDGPLACLPFEALIVPGEPAWLGVRHEVSYVPSATVWAAARGRAERHGAERPVVRVLALAATRNAAGGALEGAVREARSLARRYRGVDVRLDADWAVDEPAARVLRGYDALHVAAHAEVDATYPWRSGLLLAPRSASPEDGWWRAEQISALRIPERLVVLSSCSSASGRARYGGGVEGLTAAFLNAGASAVVSSLWPVDDKVTETLMTHFYAGLSQGKSAAASLREAKLDLAKRPATSHPRHWAAFVLTGLGEVRLPLRAAAPRPFSMWP